jgi:hypothetical protein
VTCSLCGWPLVPDEPDGEAVQVADGLPEHVRCREELNVLRSLSGWYDDELREPPA